MNTQAMAGASRWIVARSMARRVGHLNRRQPKRIERRGWSRATSNRANHVETISVTPQSPPPQSANGFNWLLPMAALVLGGLLYKPFTNQLRRIWLEPYEELEEADYFDALARTRQAVIMQRAIVFMRSNAPTRALVELERALRENQTNREILFSATDFQEEYQQLYRLYFRETAMPANFGTLLQLRRMLGISKQDAIRIQKEVTSTDSFMI